MERGREMTVSLGLMPMECRRIVLIRPYAYPAGSGAIQESQGEFWDASNYSDHSFIKTGIFMIRFDVVEWFLNF